MFFTWKFVLQTTRWREAVNLRSISLRTKFISKQGKQSPSRYLNSIASPAIDCYKPHLSARELEVRASRWSRPLRLNFTWLRDHCRCPKCYDQETAYKIVDLREVGLDCRPKHAHVKNEETLHIKWEDDHETIHNLDWLWQHSTDNYSEMVKVKRTLWDSQIGTSLRIANVPCDRLLQDDELLKTVISSFLRYGLAIVHGVKANPEASTIATVTERVSILRPSIYGRVMPLTDDTNVQPASDLYLSPVIGTAQSYLSEPGRVRIIHNTDENDTKEILMVDGFHLLECVKQHSLLLSNVIRNNIFTFIFKQDLWHYHTDHAIATDDLVTKDVLQFRFNPAVIHSPESPNSFHAELMSEVSQRLQDPSNHYRLALPPGTLLMVDNWRVALAFASTSPWKTAAMTFIGHSDIMSKARLLGLIA